ncbi:MAG: HNH endonuclease [Prevotellaceae bacterium]|jgi:5-methylcytosine-specific restriction endonuclease McrA|nr:HNH endonuclease [Prevotellaceae bacterium]
MKVYGRNDKCFYCGKEEACTKDHVFPRSKLHRQHKYRDIAWVCRFCNSLKGAMMPLDFLSYIESHPAITDEAKKRYRQAIVTLVKKIEEDARMERTFGTVYASYPQKQN